MRFKRMKGYLSNPTFRFPIIQPAKNTSAANTNPQDPMPLRSLSAARSPRVS